MSAPGLVSLGGPTASGKTALAIAVARELDGSPSLEVVSADSRQVYRGMDVGTAKPNAAERAAVPHHLIDVVDPRETYTAARFGQDARAAFAAIRARGAVPFLVGGSGLYLRAAEEGLFEGPAADPDLRARLARETDAALHVRLAAVDPAAAARLHAADRVRVIRALEVWERTGVPISEHQRRHREAAAAAPRVLRFVLDWPVLVLDARIAARVDAMVSEGWEDEVRALLARGLPADAPGLDAVGYAAMRAVVQGRMTREAARDAIVLATRQYAKRQRTWFRKVAGATRLAVAGPADLPRAAAEIAAAVRAAFAPGSG